MKKTKYKLIDTKRITPYNNMDDISGYEFYPKMASSFKIDKIIIINTEFIRYILKKKVQKKLDFYVNSIIISIEEETDDSVREALDDIARFQTILNSKYYKFLENSYYELLLKKIKNIQKKMQEKQVLFMNNPEKEYEEVEKSK